MKRSLGRNWGRAAWASAWLLLGCGGAMAQAIDHAAFRAATDDPRFPPISRGELGRLIFCHALRADVAGHRL